MSEHENSELCVCLYPQVHTYNSWYIQYANLCTPALVSSVLLVYALWYYRRAAQAYIEVAKVHRERVVGF
jgi:hypothetical protein